MMVPAKQPLNLLSNALWVCEQDWKILGVSDLVLSGWAWVVLQLSPEKESLLVMGMWVWWFLLHLVLGFNLGWSFWHSYSKKRMDFLLSCTSNCARSWQQWTLTPFKNITLYCFSREGLPNWYFSVVTAWILFLLSPSPGFWRPFNSSLYLAAVHNSDIALCVLYLLT